MISKTCFGLLCLLAVYSAKNFENYFEAREAVLKKNQEGYLGASLELNSIEECANEVLMKLKFDELSRSSVDDGNYGVALHFFKGKRLIEESKVFKILKSLPKGGALYYHDGIVSLDFLVGITYRPNLYGCYKNGIFKFHFFNGTTDNECNWKLISDMRKLYPNFDDFLRFQLSLIVDDPDAAYPTIKSVLEKRKTVEIAMEGLLSYRPVFEEYIHEVLKQYLADNVKHIESRCRVLPLYELNGKKYNKIEAAGIYYQNFIKFVSDHPDFSGFVIYDPEDIVDGKAMEKEVEQFLKLRETYGNIVAGFELSSIELTGKPVADFIPQIMRIKNGGGKLYYHSKNLDQYIENIESNLADAVLLNATKVGHINTLLRSPGTMDLLNKKQIAIEISPIADQIMKIVTNMANHPAGIAFANNYNVVITADDGALWGAVGLSYDFYMAFMAIANKNADLRFLKQIAMNSILYSRLEGEELEKVLGMWTKDWATFVNNTCMIGKL